MWHISHLSSLLVHVTNLAAKISPLTLCRHFITRPNLPLGIKRIKVIKNTKFFWSELAQLETWTKRCAELLDPAPPPPHHMDSFPNVLQCNAYITTNMNVLMQCTNMNQCINAPMYPTTRLYNHQYEPMYRWVYQCTNTPMYPTPRLHKHQYARAAFLIDDSNLVSVPPSRLAGD